MSPKQPRESGETWVNAVVELTVPLDSVTPASSAAEKQEAVAKVLSRVIESVPEGLGQFIGSAHWEEAGE
jgi:hypothetical protein